MTAARLTLGSTEHCRGKWSNTFNQGKAVQPWAKRQQVGYPYRQDGRFIGLKYILQLASLMKVQLFRVHIYCEKFSTLLSKDFGQITFIRNSCQGYSDLLQ